MDFVEGLPKSEGCDSIMVVVDRLTKFAHFVPLHHPSTTVQVARAFWEHIIKLNGVPRSIVSNRDKIFTTAIWRELLAAAGTKLLYSTSYHPQTDGQTERLARAEACFKKQADCHRAECAFDVGEQVLLKLQPYVQSSVVNCSYRKLSYKFYGPFMVAEQIGTLAYRLQLPADSRIHPAFHVSQLKTYTYVFSELPQIPDLVTGDVEPVAIVEHRMMKKGDVQVIQLQVQWSNRPQTATTWEYYDILKERYQSACIWEGAPSEDRANVTPADDDLQRTASAVQLTAVN
ncbi:uncharacterized protein [Aegilops tauschii subsp. strangulata]|uniref:uncharacterized protein n=1 Tax=Aegilops tauschii subsp. strangulata TaxID=200361 RepID=UPI00098BCC65|nr:uncharacterized protein LOC109755508 [Aegilops tauschii subsp. strangulata]